MTQSAASMSNTQTASASSSPSTFRAALLERLPFLRTLPKSMLLAGAAALVIALAAVAILWSRTPDYKVLFANLDERDGGAIVTALTQMNVPYRFSDQGGALLVPADRVHETRLQLASQGLPRGGSVGFELLDNARFGASQFSEQITWQRGLEGELTRSIEAMHHVQQARVHLAMPRQTLFVRDRQTPSASVLLNLYPGRTLTDTQVSSVAWLVAASVPGLDTEHVSIVDQNGRLLSAPGNQTSGMDSEQLRYVRDIEQLSDGAAGVCGRRDYRQRVVVDRLGRGRDAARPLAAFGARLAGAGRRHCGGDVGDCAALDDDGVACCPGIDAL